MMQKMSAGATMLLAARIDVAEQRASGDLVQHLGQLRLEARALAGGENGDGKS